MDLASDFIRALSAQVVLKAKTLARLVALLVDADIIDPRVRDTFASESDNADLS